MDMRWESLFADLESQLQAQLAEDLRAEIAESVRVEQARQTLAERLLTCQGRPLSLRLAGGEELTARLGPVGNDYLCLEESATRWLIRAAAVQTVALPPKPSAHSETVKLAAARFAAVLRALLRDRNPVQVHGIDGQLLGEGTLLQAAQDFIVLGTHARDEYARPRSITSELLIPHTALGWLMLEHRH